MLVKHFNDLAEKIGWIFYTEQLCVGGGWREYHDTNNVIKLTVYFDRKYHISTVVKSEIFTSEVIELCHY